MVSKTLKCPCEERGKSQCPWAEMAPGMPHRSSSPKGSRHSSEEWNITQHTLISGTERDQHCLSTAQEDAHLQWALTNLKHPSGVKQLLRNHLGTVCSKAQNAPQTVHLEKLNILLSFRSSTPFVILEIQTLCKALKYRCLPTSKTYIILSLTNLLC